MVSCDTKIAPGISIQNYEAENWDKITEHKFYVDIRKITSKLGSQIETESGNLFIYFTTPTQHIDLEGKAVAPNLASVT